MSYAYLITTAVSYPYPSVLEGGVCMTCRQSLRLEWEFDPLSTVWTAQHCGLLYRLAPMTVSAWVGRIEDAIPVTR